MNLFLVLVQVMDAAHVGMAEVVDRPADRAEELVVPAGPGPEVRRVAQVPLTHQSGGIPGSPEPGG